MLAVIMAFLGVPLWLIVGLLLLAIINRRRFKKMEGVFTFKARTESGKVDGIKEKYPWKSSYACWVHDVLLFHKGIALIRTIPLGVTEMSAPPESAADEEVKRMGDNPVLLRFLMDDGAVVRLVVKDSDASIAEGPFKLKPPTGFNSTKILRQSDA